MAEIIKLASQPTKVVEDRTKILGRSRNTEDSNGTGIKIPQVPARNLSPQKLHLEPLAPSDDESDDDDDDQDDDEDDNVAEVQDDVSLSPSESSSSDQNDQTAVHDHSLQDYVTMRAKKLLEVHETPKALDMREKASAILNELKALAEQIAECYSGTGSGNGTRLFARLSRHFDGDALNSITSAELLHSGVVQVLLDVFSNADGELFGLVIHEQMLLTQSVGTLKAKARMSFLEVFLNARMRNGSKTDSGSAPMTASVYWCTNCRIYSAVRNISRS